VFLVGICMFHRSKFNFEWVYDGQPTHTTCDNVCPSLHMLTKNSHDSCDAPQALELRAVLPLGPPDLHTYMPSRPPGLCNPICLSTRYPEIQTSKTSRLPQPPDLHTCLHSRPLMPLYLHKLQGSKPPRPPDLHDLHTSIHT
jgi:hypothetical protein